MGMKIVMKNKNKVTIYNKKKVYDKVKNEPNKDLTQWKGVGEKKVYILLKISKYHLHIMYCC